MMRHTTFLLIFSIVLSSPMIVMGKQDKEKPYTKDDTKTFDMLYGDRVKSALGRKDKEALATEFLKASETLEGGIKVVMLMAAVDMVDYNSPDLAIPLYDRLCEAYPQNKRKLLKDVLQIEVKVLRTMMSELRRKKTPYVKDRKFYGMTAKSIDHYLDYSSRCFEELRFDDPRKYSRDIETFAEAISSPSLEKIRFSTQLASLLKTQYTRALSRKSIWGLLEVGAYEKALSHIDKASDVEKTCILLAAGEDVPTDKIFTAALEWDERSRKKTKTLRLVYQMRAADLYEKCLSNADSSKATLAKARLTAISSDVGEFLNALRKPTEWTYLTELPIVSSSVGWGSLKVVKPENPAKFGIAGIKVVSGIRAHANSKVVFNLNGKYRELQASFGLETGAGGSAKFRVVADGKTIYQGGGMWKQHNYAMKKPIELKIVGVQKLELISEHLGSAAGSHSAWGNCKVR